MVGGWRLLWWLIEFHFSFSLEFSFNFHSKQLFFLTTRSLRLLGKYWGIFIRHELFLKNHLSDLICFVNFHEKTEKSNKHVVDFHLFLKTFFFYFQLFVVIFQLFFINPLASTKYKRLSGKSSPCFGKTAQYFTPF